MAAPLGLRFLIVAAMRSTDSLVASPSPGIKYQSHDNSRASPMCALHLLQRSHSHSTSPSVAESDMVTPSIWWMKDETKESRSG